MDKKNKSNKFLAIPEDFIFFSEKISINKSELSKAVNVGGQSGESGYTLVPISHNKENREFEDNVADEMNQWIKYHEKNLKAELEQFYTDLNGLNR